MKISFQILHSFFLSVVLSFVLETINVFPVFKIFSIEASAFLSFFFLCGIVAVKGFFYAGALGSLLELVSGEELVVSIQAFKDNARKFWKICVFVVGARILGDFLFSHHWMSYSVIRVYIDFFLILFLVLRIVSLKYVVPLRLARQKLVLSSSSVLNISRLFFAGLCCSLAMAFFTQNDNRLAFTGALLGYQYFYFLIFVYLSCVYLQQISEIGNTFQFKKELFLVAPPVSDFLFGMTSLLFRFHYGAFVVLKALTPSEYHTREFRGVMWDERYFKKGILVAITCYSSNSAIAYKIAKEFRARGSKVIMGGPHVSFFPQEALTFCDSVVLGDAEGVWEEIIKDYEAETLKKIYIGREGTLHQDQQIQDYLMHTASIEEARTHLHAQRGCKFNCYFCSQSRLSSHLHQKSIEDVVALIEKIKQKSNVINFSDNNIYSNPDYAKKLFKALIPLKIKWIASASIDIAKSDETLRLLKESGCRALLIGYETYAGSPEEKMRGKFTLVNEYLTLSQRIKRQKIAIKAHFIFGFESDNLKNLAKLWWFCLRLFPSATAVSVLTPVPGSQFFFDMVKEGRLTNLNWSYYDLHALVFRHKEMNNFFLSLFSYPIFFFFLLTTSSLGVSIILLLLSAAGLLSKIF